MDVIKSSFLNKSTLPFLKDNLNSMKVRCRPEGVEDSEFNVENTENQYQKVGITIH